MSCFYCQETPCHERCITQSARTEVLLPREPGESRKDNEDRLRALVELVGLQHKGVWTPDPAGPDR